MSGRPFAPTTHTRAVPVDVRNNNTSRELSIEVPRTPVTTRNTWCTLETFVRCGVALLFLAAVLIPFFWIVLDDEDTFLHATSASPPNMPPSPSHPPHVPDAHPSSPPQPPGLPSPCIGMACPLQLDLLTVDSKDTGD